MLHERHVSIIRFARHIDFLQFDWWRIVQLVQIVPFCTLGLTAVFLNKKHFNPVVEKNSLFFKIKFIHQKLIDN